MGKFWQRLRDPGSVRDLLRAIPRPKPPIYLNYDHELPQGQYYEEAFLKDLLVLHHTVGGSARSSINWWMANEERVGTAFVIDRDGTVYVAFDPTLWAWHLGCGIRDLEQRSIGIELASEGPLIEIEGLTYTLFKNPKTGRYIRSTDPHIKLHEPWRGHQYFDAYEPKQIESAIEIVELVLDDFPTIPRRYPEDPLEFDPDLRNFTGILSHSHVREDKSDVNPSFPWARLAQELELEAV